MLDELVPRPGPRWKRVVLWIAFFAVVAGATWSVTSGTVVPQVSTWVTSWGGPGPVGVTVSVHNDGRVPIEIVGGPGDQPGLDLLGYTTGSTAALDAGPAGEPATDLAVRIEPHQTVELTAWYRVADCDAIDRATVDDHTIELQVRVAEGPASRFTREQHVDASALGTLEADDASWPVAVAEHPCRT